MPKSVLALMIAAGLLLTPFSLSAQTSGGDPFIENARANTLAFLKELPDFVVRQDTKRHVRSRSLWYPQDHISAELVFNGGRENYRDVSIDGKPVSGLDIRGSWSTGQFASLLKDFFEPKSQTVFKQRGSDNIGGREARTYDFSVKQPNSGWQLQGGWDNYLTAYSGTLWLDAETAQVLRFKVKGEKIPKDFPLKRAELQTDFGPVEIGAGEVLLPAKAEVLACARASNDCFRNEIEFTGYRKFTANAVLDLGRK